MDFYKVVSVEEAKHIIKSEFKFNLKEESVEVKNAINRILFRDIEAPINIPGFRKSMVDGYAVRYKDLQGASESIPSILALKGEVKMGKTPSQSLDFPGECMYIPTGGMVPKGADSIVMIEYTEKMDDSTVLANKPVYFGENVFDSDEDVEKGEIILKRGTKIKPYGIGLLSSFGISEIPVFSKPRVGIISTGDEIISPWEYPKPGETRDINSYLLYSSVIEDGGDPVLYGVIKDEYEKLYNAVVEAVHDCDIVLVSGGSSVGKKDQTVKVIKSVGELLLHGISIKPGKPTILGKIDGKPVFGLPGHPLSCAVVYRILVRHSLQTMMEFNEIEYPVLCEMGVNYHSAKGREEYLPVNLYMEDERYKAVPVMTKSAAISAFTRAWGYIKIDKNIEGIPKGQKTYAYKFQR